MRLTFYSTADSEEFTYVLSNGGGGFLVYLLGVH